MQRVFTQSIDTLSGTGGILKEGVRREVKERRREWTDGGEKNEEE